MMSLTTSALPVYSRILVRGLSTLVPRDERDPPREDEVSGPSSCVPGCTRTGGTSTINYPPGTFYALLSTADHGRFCLGGLAKILKR